MAKFLSGDGIPVIKQLGDGRWGSKTEVENIRTGYDGTVYLSAGDAVRGQIQSGVTAIQALSVQVEDLDTMKMDAVTVPTTDGIYNLAVTISNGSPTYSWITPSGGGGGIATQDSTTGIVTIA